MGYRIIPVEDAGDQRERLVAFLANFEGERRSEAFWSQRLASWWETNPCHNADTPRGWLAEHNGEVVGFFGVIASTYAYAGREYLAIGGTAWRVERSHRSQSLPLFLKFHAYRTSHILIDATPNETAQLALERLDYRRAEDAVEHRFLLRQGRGQGLRRVADPAATLDAKRLPQLSGPIVTLDDELEFPTPQDYPYLRRFASHPWLEWYCALPGRTKDFLGCVDAKGRLTSWMIAGEPSSRWPGRVRVIDHFTVRSEPTELLGLVRHVCENPGSTPQSGRGTLLTMCCSTGDPRWQAWRGSAWRRKRRLPSYFSLPAELAAVPKVTGLAEGDYGC